MNTLHRFLRKNMCEEMMERQLAPTHLNNAPIQRDTDPREEPPFPHQAFFASYNGYVIPALFVFPPHTFCA